MPLHSKTSGEGARNHSHEIQGLDLARLSAMASVNKSGAHEVVRFQEGDYYDLWATELPLEPVADLVPVEEECASYMSGENADTNTFVRVFRDESRPAAVMQTPATFLLCVCPRNPTYHHHQLNKTRSISLQMERFPPLWPIANRHNTWKLTILGFFGIAAGVVIFWRSVFPSNDSYHRYPTPHSMGPKNQARLLYNNSTHWARENDFNDENWRVRIDDQAIVPALLYTDDEDKYQSWFRKRYPHLHHVVRSHTFLRPSWLGSTQIAVPWDEQFHFAHCVLALRRYWVAKETGKHVCGRDIDHAHMKHCLDSLDEKAFPPGPMENRPGEHLWWQTKACYD